MEHNNTATTIKLISDLLEKKANSELGRYNITLSQARILSVLFLSKADSLSLKALEKLFSVSQATMQGTISRLVKKGLVETHFRDDDKKTKYVSITSEGKLLAAGFSSCLKKVNHSLSESLTEEESAQLEAILKKVYKNLKTKI